MTSKHRNHIIFPVPRFPNCVWSQTYCSNTTLKQDGKSINHDVHPKEKTIRIKTQNKIKVYVTVIVSVSRQIIIFIISFDTSYVLRKCKTLTSKLYCRYKKNYLNMRHRAWAQKYKLSSQLQRPIYCMSNKMDTLLRYQPCYATHLFHIKSKKHFSLK